MRYTIKHSGLYYKVFDNATMCIVSKGYAMADDAEQIAEELNHAP